MGVFHKHEFRIRYDAVNNYWEVHRDYGLLLRSWAFKEWYHSYEEALTFVENEKAKLSKERYAQVTYK